MSLSRIEDSNSWLRLSGEGVKVSGDKWKNAFVIVLVMAVTIETTNGIRSKHVTGNVTQTLDYLLASSRYDKRLRPGFGGSPVTISVNFFIKSMGPVSENDQSFGLDCYFRQHWYDLRLRYQKFPGLEEFSMSWLFLDRVWKPDTYFINGKRSYLHKITVPNKFLRLRHDGFITYSMRLTITASCPMHLRKFPLDAQRCPLVLGSYGYTNKDLVYKWTEETPIGLQPGVEIAQFDLVNITTEGEKDMVLGRLPHSTVQANFWLKRHTGYFMLQVYIPCGLIVVCSWISFWIDPDAVPARVTLGTWSVIPVVGCSLVFRFWIYPDDVAARAALGVTTVLSLTTMGFGGRAQLPKVSYWTALDWFVIICFTSVFSVMIEYAIVNFIDKFNKDLKKIIQKRMEEEEEAKKRETAEMEAKSKPISFKHKQRSASFSFSTSTREKEIQTTVQLEAKPSHPDIVRNFPGSLSAAVVAYFYPPLTQTRSKSIPNLKLTTEEEDPLKTDTKNDSRHLIDLAGETEPVQVVLDIQEDDFHRETGEDIEVKKKRKIGDFMKSIKHPRFFWSKILERTELIQFDPPDKFSRIDVQSRRNFPIAFFLSLVVYLFAFSYYLTDDIPVRDSDAECCE